MKILFLHGWQSVPGGVKPVSLRQRGHEVLNPQLPDHDFAESVRIASQLCSNDKPDVVVGSSRGGAVAMAIENPGAPLLLLCPAWRHYGVAPMVAASTLIIHSRRDEVIPFTDSQEILRASGLHEQALMESGVDHRLADDESLARMNAACEVLAQNRNRKRAS
jgi:alpha-beta hydrolase superfamily lysophospholipase